MKTSTYLDLPIALRKGKRVCTQHPISNFVSNDKLSAKFSAFSAKVPNLQSPKNIDEVLADKNWRDAV